MIMKYMYNILDLLYLVTAILIWDFTALYNTDNVLFFSSVHQHTEEKSVKKGVCDPHHPDLLWM